MTPLQSLQRLFDMEGRGYEQLRADLRALGHHEPPMRVGVTVLVGLFVVLAFACACFPDAGAIR